MTKEELATQRTELKSAMKALRENIKKVSVEFIKSAFSDVFKKYPNLKSFSWNQGTPGWNDGDPCEFSAHTYQENIGINGVENYTDSSPVSQAEYEIRETKDQIEKFNRKNNAYQVEAYKKQLADDLAKLEAAKVSEEGLTEATEEISAILRVFDDEDLECMFGDDVTVTVTPEGVETDSWECGY